DLWVREKQLNAERWAREPRLRSAARVLLRDETACRGPARQQLVAALDALLGPETAPAALLVGRDGRVVAARQARDCGRALAPALARPLSEALRGVPSFAGPLREAPQDAGGAATRPLVWIAAPVRDDDDTPAGALFIGKYADDRFSAVFAAARLGESGEAYAFDLAGRMLSKSRFRSQLVEAGRLAPEAGEILALALRDPESPEGALTALVQAAIAARSATPPNADRGEVTAAYNNYLGVRVVGAWRWLPQYDFGVAVEVAEAEAYAPLARLQRAFLAVLLAAGAALLFLLVALARIVRLRRAVREAQRVGNYELLEEVGHGGMARVYRARHRLLKRPTAVKIIELAVANDEMLARFDREVKLASQLMHPNTVEVFDYGRTPEGQPFYAMEYLDGLTLQQLVEAHGPLPPARVAHVLRGIAGSLSEAHTLGLVHRDIKPANVMLCRRGGEYDVVKVLDFGLIKDIRTEATRDLTRALRVLGTPAYMAPERIENAASADPRSDLYALGAVGYFLLAGAPPFAADNDLALAYQVVHKTPPPLPPERAVPDELADLIFTCLAKDPAQRPQFAADLIEALDFILLRHPWPATAARAWWEAQDAARALAGVR
ncbi:MAG: serine/threonine protein kinase, partial [Burkholderiaceae bacterium]|nr:serine/threonine protein kinase [Burkholderiaceae bacterium]